MKTLRKTVSLLLAAALIFSFGAFASADAEPTPVGSCSEFNAMRNNPSGSYILTADLDFSEYTRDWKPFAFSGTLDGGGHTIKNLHSESYSEEDVRIVVDANLKEYEAVFSGLFSSAENAVIKNLNVRNLRVEIGGESCELPMFAGILAGYAYNTTVENCNFSGRVDTTTAGHCFGAGGVFGFAGACSIENSSVDSTLVCVDTDKAYKDEQFMGGAYAFGYSNVNHCTIKIDGYDSDHGYVHDGGLVGCFMYYDKQHVGEVSMSYNDVSGQITFFEDNKDRRAYCKAYGGEMMSWKLTMDGNTQNFVRNEVKDYSKVLLPKDWEEPLEGCTDILLLSSHADDEQLFFAGLLPYYAQVRGLGVQVVYATDHTASSGRNQERLNGLWGVGIKHKPDSFGYYDAYSESYEGALKNLAKYDITEEDVIEDIHRMILKYKPQVIVTHDVNGEYGHGMHILMSGAMQKCLEKYGSEFSFLKKVYLHLYEENPVVLSCIDQPFDALDGKTPFQITQDCGFSEHKSQHWTWFYGWIYGKGSNKITAASQIKTYSPLNFGLVWGDPSLDASGEDLFEGMVSYEEQERIRREEEKRREEEARKAEEERIAAEKKAEEEAKALAKKKRIAIIVGGCIVAAGAAVYAVRRKKEKKND